MFKKYVINVFLRESHRPWVLGGIGSEGAGSSSEVLSEDGTVWEAGPELPAELGFVRGLVIHVHFRVAAGTKKRQERQ